jgi:two-component system, NtrC family, response regulator AtoC
MARRIMLVEDNDLLREALEMHFAANGVEILAVESAEMALARIRDFAPDIVLTDVRLGDMDGLELLERLQQQKYPADVVVMTGHEDMHDAIRAIQAGAYDYLVKPFEGEEIDEIVQRCFRDRADRGKGSSDAHPETDSQGMIVSRSPAMIRIWKEVGRLGDVKTPVLIRGDTGTGKELVARAIHEHSRWREEPFIAINCTAVAETLLESELFGHVRGAFTGAVGDRRGRFELAGEGTIFLDEIGDTSVSFQAKLLRVIQEHEYHPVGSERAKQTKARVIAATHRPVEELIREGKFREDLYFRLRVVEISIPPLRERAGDIPLLVDHFLGKLSRQLQKPRPHITREAMRVLEAYEWPGNVRELENALTRVIVLAQSSSIRPEDLSFLGLDAGMGPPKLSLDRGSLEEAEWRHVERVLASCGHNKSQAARSLGISRPRLDRILARNRGEAVVAS